MHILFQIFIMIASAAISSALAPKPKTPKPAALSDFEFPQIDESTPQAVIFGDCWSEDWFVLGTGNFRSTPIKR
jgi:hypothetical protein